jgi:hypothetical protein
LFIKQKKVWRWQTTRARLIEQMLSETSDLLVGLLIFGVESGTLLVVCGIDAASLSRRRL